VGVRRTAASTSGDPADANHSAYTIDALVTGNWLALKSAFQHLALRSRR